MRILCLLELSLFVTLTACAPRGAPVREEGVVVESVVPRSAGAAAGLQPGDVLLGWAAAAAPPALPRPAGGSLRSPYDLLPLEIEQAPRRAVILHGRRGNEERAWTLGSANWGLQARPGFPPELAERYRAGQAQAKAGDFAAAGRSWRSAAEAARAGGDGRLAAWFLDRLAEALADAGQWPASDSAYREAVAELEQAPDSAATAALLRVWAVTYQKRGRWAAAIARYQKALALDRRAASGSLAAARTLNAQGAMEIGRSDYPAAEIVLRQALAIGEELAPAGTGVAESLRQLGVLARLRGDLAAAERYLARGEELQRRLAPASAGHALFLLNRSHLARERGDLAGAERLSRQALSILVETAPASEDLASCLQQLMVVAYQRGDLATADDLLRRVRALEKRRPPDPLARSWTLIYLGHLALDRGDPEAAEARYRQALALQERISPQGRETAASLANLGSLVNHLRNDTASARTYLQSALEIKEKLAPGSLDVAVSLENLSHVAGDLATAEGLLRRALAIHEERAPESLNASIVLRNLGQIVALRGRPQEALRFHRRALELQHKLAPGSLGEAATLYMLGGVERQAGRHREGVRHLCRALDVLDTQRARLGAAPETTTPFEGYLGLYYHGCLNGLLDLGRSAEAFHVVERGRARSFLALLAERDLRFADLPPALAAERRRLNAEYDRVQAQLARAGRDDAAVGQLTGALRDLRTRQEEVRARIRRASPRAAALDPQPLDLTGARAALDPGTVLLAYAVGPERSWLFVVQPQGTGEPGLTVLPIAAGEADLRGEVERFRLLVGNPRSGETELQRQARRLYDLLVRPAEARLHGARRILISAHGPLHTLPFAALRRGSRFLIEWKPLHFVLSATVYAELGRPRPIRRNPRDERLVAFGDPVFRPGTTRRRAGWTWREACLRGLNLNRLPFSGREVRAIAALYPRAQVYLGRQATEERAKALGPKARLVHFACHGLLDERFPLNSALALTLPEQILPGRDNGLLQSWEIFESLRLDADLVTLSACDTALGQEISGEGLIGLTRAFQSAGARSVLATLWGVSDRSTYLLMPRFYGHLRSGKPKDEALRAAQLDLLREGPSDHPFHWAAFQLTGDASR